MKRGWWDSLHVPDKKNLRARFHRLGDDPSQPPIASVRIMLGDDDVDSLVFGRSAANKSRGRSRRGSRAGQHRPGSTASSMSRISRRSRRAHASDSDSDNESVTSSVASRKRRAAIKRVLNEAEGGSSLGARRKSRLGGPLTLATMDVPSTMKTPRRRRTRRQTAANGSSSDVGESIERFALREHDTSHGRLEHERPATSHNATRATRLERLKYLKQSEHDALTGVLAKGGDKKRVTMAPTASDPDSSPPAAAGPRPAGDSGSGTASKFGRSAATLMTRHERERDEQARRAWKMVLDKTFDTLFKGRLRMAFRELNAFLALHPHFVEAARARANLYYHHGMLDEAMRDYNNLINRGHGDYVAHFRRGVLFDMKAKTTLAVLEFTKAIMHDGTQPDAYIRRARCHVARENLDGALFDLSAAIRADRHCKVAYGKRGWLNARMGNFDAALYDLSVWIKLDPDDARAYQLRGSLLRHRLPLQALQDLSICLMLDPRNARAMYTRALIYHRLDQNEAALSDYRECVRLDGGLVGAYVNMALIEMEVRHDYATAILCCARALDVRPRFERAHVIRATAYQIIGEDDLAIRDYSSVLHSNPEHEFVYRERARVLLRIGRPERALYDMICHARVQPADEPEELVARHVLLGRLFLLAGKPVRALEHLMRARAIRPSVHVYYHLGLAFMDARNFTSALNVLMLARASDVRGVMLDVHMAMGKCLGRLGMHVQALEVFSGVIRKNKRLAHAYHERALSHLQLPVRSLDRELVQRHHAISDFRKAVALDPSNLVAFVQRGDLYASLGRTSLALADYDRACALDANFHVAFLNRAVLMYRQGHVDAALADFDHVLARDEDNVLAQYNRGLVLAARGQLDDALLALSIVILATTGAAAGAGAVSLTDRDAAAIAHPAVRARASVYQRQGEFAAAIHDLVQLPLDASVGCALAECLHGSGADDDALVMYETVLAMPELAAGERWAVHMAVARLHMDRGEVASSPSSTWRRPAMRHLSMAIHMVPERIAAHVLLNAIVASGHKSARGYAFILERNPGNVDALRGRARLALRRDDPGAAVIDLTTALGLVPSQSSAAARILVDRGMANVAMGHVKAARADFTEAIARAPAPDDAAVAAAHVGLGDMLLRASLYSQAIDAYTRALSAQPEGQPGVYNNRAIANALLGRWARARADLDRAGDGVDACINRSRVLAALGDRTAVGDLLRNVVARMPMERAYAPVFADLASATTDNAEALRHFNSALVLDEDLRI